MLRVSDSLTCRPRSTHVIPAVLLTLWENGTSNITAINLSSQSVNTHTRHAPLNMDKKYVTWDAGVLRDGVEERRGEDRVEEGGTVKLNSSFFMDLPCWRNK